MRVLLFVVLVSAGSVLQAAAPPGHPTPDQAVKLMGGGAAVSRVQRGEVLEAIDSNSYTYIRVRVSAQQSQWLAAPRLALQVGQHIDYPQGVLMRDFYSKKLKRRFEQILFVSAVTLAI